MSAIRASTGSVLFTEAQRRMTSYAARAAKLERDAISPLEPIFKLALLLDTDTKRSAFFQLHGINADVRTRNPVQPIVRKLATSAGKSVTANVTKWAGCVAHAVDKGVDVNGFRAFVTKRGGVHATYRKYAEAQKTSARKVQDQREKKNLINNFLLSPCDYSALSGYQIAIVTVDNGHVHHKRLIELGDRDTVDRFIFAQARRWLATQQKAPTAAQVAA